MPRCSRLVAAVLGVLVMASLLAGCGDSAEPPALRCPVASDAPLALALSRRANSAEALPPVVEQAVLRFVSGTPVFVRGPQLSVVNIDGRPEVLENGSVSFYSDAKSDALLADDRQKFLAAVSGIVGRVRADDPEVDIIGALDAAAIAAGRDADGGLGRGAIVLADSGLSTAGALNFTQAGVLGASPAELVAFLERENALPDVKGLSVTIVVGAVAEPQPDLAHHRRDLVTLLRMIAERGGASCVDVLEMAPTASAPRIGLPPVTVVPVPPVVEFTAQCAGVLSDTGDVGFEPGRASFRDPVAARAVIEPIATALRDPQCGRVQLTGTTARATSESEQRDLGGLRAEAVKRELVELGVDPTLITTVGLGSYFVGYVPDNGPDGKLLPGPAQLNRTVRIDPCRPDCPSYEVR